MTESVRAYAHERPSVLLVEAEPMLRLTMTKFLRRSGYEVTACDGVESAGTVLAGNPGGVALIVLGVRVLNGESAAAARRLRDAAPDVPMLGIADALDQHSDSGLSLPDNLRFLAHPFDMPDVLRAVRSCLRQSGFHTAIGDPV